MKNVDAQPGNFGLVRRHDGRIVIVGPAIASGVKIRQWLSNGPLGSGGADGEDNP